MSQAEVNDLARRASDELYKYTHLLLAFSASAIAYALSQAQGNPISWVSAPLFFALAAWLASMYFGVNHLQLHRAHMIENAHSLIEDETKEEMKNRLLHLDIKTGKASSKQYWLIVFGVASYITWFVVGALNV